MGMQTFRGKAAVAGRWQRSSYFQGRIKLFGAPRQ